MLAFTELLNNLEEVRIAKEKINKGILPIAAVGVTDSQKCHLAYTLGHEMHTTLVIAYNEIRAKELYEDYRFFDKNALLFPSRDLIFFNADIHSNEITQQRLDVIKNLVQNNKITIITTIDACMDKLLPISYFEKMETTIKVGDSLDIEKLTHNLVEMGYEATAQVEGKGQFAVRGGIIDIYPTASQEAYRIELWDIEVDSIRIIDVENQRSTEKVDSITIFPSSELIINNNAKKRALDMLDKEYEQMRESFMSAKNHEALNNLKAMMNKTKAKLTDSSDYASLDGLVSYFYEETSSFLDYLNKDNTLIIIDEPARMLERADAIELEFRESMSARLEQGYVLPTQVDILLHYADIVHRLNNKKTVIFSMLQQTAKEYHIKYSFNIDVSAVATYNGSIEALIKDLTKWKNKKYKVMLLVSSRTRAERMAKDLLNEGLNAYYSDTLDKPIKEGEVVVTGRSIRRGFEYPLLKFVLITETDIFGRSELSKRKRKKVSSYSGTKISSFSQLTVGDYVVHENRGLGIYCGIEKVKVERSVRDCIRIQYSGSGALLMPTTQLDMLQKYVGGEGKKIKLSSLTSQDWSKTKAKVSASVKQLAIDLVALYAKRRERKGHMYSEDTVWQKEFEELFPYEETFDQLNAIKDTKQDMESNKIMDRLICGDVGYGKTEIAIRAAFKAVQEGKQVAYLVPTTILAQQHYNTFVQRMKDFPVRVDLMCRFKTKNEQKSTLEGIKKGYVDIVIGTHRILSKDLEFKELGLLIIDEEQRFGVAHKEKIKELKADIDVLTLTATPIPRTLHMSLIGIRDMSVLEEPPEERQPIQTYVLEQNDQLVREAINRELGRGGQVYYVYNQVNNIEEVAEKVRNLVPDANVAFAHGQMHEHQLEKVMFAFINGEVDVLVTTTIIETGLDISNVNTMIIQDADKLGLSQLYQLRGRVGRSNRTAYAYLMYKRDKMLKEIAEKRLQAIKEFTQLGSGFKIAMRDLEIRGTGNLLGAEQHGNMDAVGYDMYCKMLDKAIKGIKNNDKTESFETTIDLDIDAYIPDTYILEEVQKLDIYKRIACIDTENDYNDIYDELVDRFGDLPTSVINLLDIALLKSRANKIYIQGIEQKKNYIKLFVLPKAQLDVAGIPDLIKKYEYKLTFKVEDKPHFALTIKQEGRKELFEQLNNLLSSLQDLKIKQN